MFVFTVTNRVTNDVYVGSTKDDVESYWGTLINAAEDGQEGDIYKDIRSYSPADFEVEEWASAENGKELRELVAEARESMDAIPIKPGRKSAAMIASSHRVSEEIRELFAVAEAEVLGDDESLEPATEGKSKSSAGDSVESPQSAGLGLSNSVSRPIEAAADSSKVANGRSGSATKERRIKEALAQEREVREGLRQNQTTREADEMKAVMIQIEHRRQSQKKRPRPAAKKKSAAGSLRSAVSSKPPTAKSAAEKPASVAKGRTGSAVKEKRIKEAIAQQKAELDQQKEARVAAEADEMAAILNRLDSRSKVATTYKRKL